MTLTIAVDIGGTHIRVAAYEPDSTIPIAHHKTKSLAQTAGVYDRLVKAINHIWQDGQVSAIGIASPGPLDPHAGVILDTPNIPDWENFPLAAKLTEQFGVPAYLDNDANMAGLAEWQYGAGQGHHDLVYLTISTGIGGGVISNDHLLQGYRGMGAELGHMLIDPNGPICGCGQHGHIESFSSGPSIIRYFNEQRETGQKSSLQPHPNLGTAQLAEAALTGDALAISAFKHAGHYLGIAVANILAIFDPSILIFGGGVSQVGELLFKPFEESLKKHVFHLHYMDGLVITKAALGDDAGLLGALALARMKRDESQ
ncbi:MAG TPA: ROK family protein [Anaerolineales bacterium]|nr:ROK family protein [Anaerolineales bacterium]